MILFFYNLALLTALVAGAPWWLWRMVTTQKYREGLGERLGRVPQQVRTASAGRQPVIWLHAVSVGEVLAVSRLVQELGRPLPVTACLSPRLLAPGRNWRAHDSALTASSIVLSTFPGQSVPTSRHCDPGCLSSRRLNSGLTC